MKHLSLDTYLPSSGPHDINFTATCAMVHPLATPLSTPPYHTVHDKQNQKQCKQNSSQSKLNLCILYLSCVFPNSQVPHCCSPENYKEI